MREECQALINKVWRLRVCVHLLQTFSFCSVDSQRSASSFDLSLHVRLCALQEVSQVLEERCFDKTVVQHPFTFTVAEFDKASAQAAAERLRVLRSLSIDGWCSRFKRLIFSLFFFFFFWVFGGS